MDLDRADLLRIYRALVRARAAKERLEVLFRQGHIGGGLYRSLGQEGASVGAACALRRRDDGTLEDYFLPQVEDIIAAARYLADY